MHQKNCKTCEKSFSAKRSDTKYCSSACKQKPYNDKIAEQIRDHCRRKGIRVQVYKKKQKFSGRLQEVSVTGQKLAVTNEELTVTKEPVSVTNHKFTVTNYQIPVTKQEGNNKTALKDPVETALYTDFSKSLANYYEKQKKENLQEANSRLQTHIKQLLKLQEKDEIRLFEVESVLRDLNSDNYFFNKVSDFPYWNFIKLLKDYLETEIKETKREGLRKFEFILETKIILEMGWILKSFVPDEIKTAETFL